MPGQRPTQQQCEGYQTTDSRDLAINDMPVLREIVWRHPHQPCANFDGKRPECYREATVVQLRGHLRKVDCERCHAGKGPFTQCVMALLPSGEHALGGKCANCHYEKQACKSIDTLSISQVSSIADGSLFCACQPYI